MCRDSIVAVPQPGKRRIDPIRHPLRTKIPQRHKPVRQRDQPCRKGSNILIGHARGFPQVKGLPHYAAQLRQCHPAGITRFRNSLRQRTRHLPGVVQVFRLQIGGTQDVCEYRRQRTETDDTTSVSVAELALPIHPDRLTPEPLHQLIGQQQRTDGLEGHVRRPDLLCQRSSRRAELFQLIRQRRIRRTPGSGGCLDHPRDVGGPCPKILPVPVRQRREVRRHVFIGFPQLRQRAQSATSHRVALQVPCVPQSFPRHLLSRVRLRHHQPRKMVQIALGHRMLAGWLELVRPPTKQRTQNLG